MHRRASFAVLGLAALAALTASAPAQSPAPTFGERVEVSVVNVEVYVTDRDGDPIAGLTQDDFTLLEDGKPVEISNFSAFEGGAAIEVREGAAGIEPAPAVPPPPEHRLSLVLYVDNLHLQPASRKRALAQVREFLAESFVPGSRVMVVSYERSPKVIQPFTEDLALALSKLDGLAKSRPIGVEGRASRQNTLSQIQAIYDNDGCSEFARDQMRALTAAHVQPQAHEDAQSFTGLSAVIGSLAGLPGRKVVFHISDGVPLVSGQEVIGLANALCEGAYDAGTSDLSQHRRLRRVATQANAAGVTFYTLEAAGLRPPAASSAEQARPTLSARLESESIANDQDTLFSLADDTGGRALLNSNRLDEALVSVGRDLSNFYWLGYAAARDADGRVHRLEVRVRREGARVQHRRSYRDKTAEDRREERVLAALLIGQEDNALGAALEPGAAIHEPKGQVLMPIRLRLPMARLTLLPADGGARTGRLRLAMAARDAEGGTTPVRTVELPIQVAAAQLEAALARDFLYEVRMAMRPGPHRVALAIEDVPTGVTSYLALDFEVPKR